LFKKNFCTTCVLFCTPTACKLSKEELSEIKKEFNKLSEEEKGEVIIHFYTSLSSRYNSGISGSFISWFPGSRESLEKLMNTV
jgi:hypothetical protein